MKIKRLGLILIWIVLFVFVIAVAESPWLSKYLCKCLIILLMKVNQSNAKALKEEKVFNLY